VFGGKIGSNVPDGKSETSQVSHDRLRRSHWLLRRRSGSGQFHFLVTIGNHLIHLLGVSFYGCRLPTFWLLGPIHLILLPEMNGQAMSV
jgi:hypothetical protein